ncbi:hypothetical protein Plhal703r1_c22g0095211 [Plasmopara halstedii]
MHRYPSAPPRLLITCPLEAPSFMLRLASAARRRSAYFCLKINEGREFSGVDIFALSWTINSA